MRHRPRLAAVLLVAMAALACNDAPLDTPDLGAPPAVATPNGAMGVTVGERVSLDLTRGGTAFTGTGPLAYTVTLEGAGNGLSASGANVVGQPLDPGVTWGTVVATDAQGRTASDRFAVVAFAPGLAVPTLPTVPFRYADVPLPAHFRARINGAVAEVTDNTPADNPITDAGAALGRVLFYDMRLSANDGLSCAGCHSPFIGFSDTPQRSVGFNGRLTPRHSPALVNARFYGRGRFLWDERAISLEAQVLLPIQDPAEMGLPLNDAVAKISATPYYGPLFTAAFGSPAVTDGRVARALAQYVRSLVSTDSRYDRAFTAGGTPNFAAVLTPQEIEGEQLFRTAGCAACHTTVAQVSDAPHNNGLDVTAADTGSGRGMFKSPSLRNVGVRPRFMHDGRFTTLEQVVDFYDTGIQPNPFLHQRLRGPDGPLRLNLTAPQKEALVAFLHTLTDSAFLTAPRFANPFAPPPGAPLVPGQSVVMQATTFLPGTLTVPPGTVVTWMNADNARHSVNFEQRSIGATAIFASGTRQLIMPTAPGTYDYQCAVHGAAMAGTIVVR
jgi:cytochrome c peroxidase